MLARLRQLDKSFDRYMEEHPGIEALLFAVSVVAFCWVLAALGGTL